MKKIIAVLAFGLMLSGNASAQSYLCIAEAAGGVEYNSATKKFNGMGFAIDSKHIIKKENNEWIYNKFGRKHYPWETCKEHIYKGIINGVTCQLLMGELYIAFQKLRYWTTYTPGFTVESAQEGNTPYIEVGSCSEI